jgi:Fe2+ or Zn2+ uptake regulation protein
LEYYVKILRKGHLKVTQQRIDILKYLDSHESHPTAEEIYSSLKKTHPALSKTTVYNSLDALRKHGIIAPLTITENETRYDIKTEMHHHFLCKKCGQIIDIDISCPNIEKISKFGHRVDEVHGYFKGICKNCLDKGRENNKSQSLT